MVLYPPHTITSTNTASTIVSGDQIEDQNLKPRRTIRKHDRATDAEGRRLIIDTERPSFGQWLKAAWPDLITMIIVGAVGLGAYWAPPAPNRSFPIHSQDGTIVFPEFAYPLRREVVPIWAATLLASLAPIAIILIMQIRIRSFWDAHNAIVGLLYSLITAAVFQVFLKWLIGGLRPHFLAVCKPRIPKDSNASGNGFDGVMYDRSWCTGDKNKIDDSLESFPSGHTTAAFAGFVYLYLYLNAKLKVWSNYHPAYWKLIVTYIPILGAVLIGGALTIDEFHNWYDIIAGAAIGTVMAVSAFRMVFASIWDFRYNHIPLMRHHAVTHDGNSSALTCCHGAVWTREAGWGTKATRV
ncbi:hypothetical protein KC316_g3854 [Hortaea werneckii]|uniref:Phosphatidic acid phosphatase type 2/haloperoxidase domain-containing protein n=1 Tax=Hortaea werneckii TaxID=91943 RepID=A0A3M6Y020_HORWE|nr:hypothetical protein KC324_g3900 [Hortaea werneckii]KAI7589579.1 hypothetical protein KC316_g3854 [Hortaea werneckii]RMX96383.1 hypothetical protein D0868_11210 [Hortaea werneckii]